MFDLLNDKSFIEFVLERGNIPFVVRGNLSCDMNFSFAPFAPVQISRPTYYLKSYGRNARDEDDLIDVFVSELHEEVIFTGEISLPEKSVRGVTWALNRLELWADLLCLTVGNPKISIEVQRPLNAVITTRREMEPRWLKEWAALFVTLSNLEPETRKRVSAALWWYRKACGASHYSIFDSYTANWNCLEILCNVSGSRIRKGTEVDQAVRQYLAKRKRIRAGHILECYNRYVNYSIKEQVKDALKRLSQINQQQAEQIVYQCFEISPRENQLYQIRNDINHGNISENSANDVERVFLRGTLLSNIIFMLLYCWLGQPMSKDVDINDLAASIANPPWRKNKEEPVPP